MALVPTCRSAARIAAAFVMTAFALAVSAAEIDQPAPELDIALLNGKTLRAKTLRGKVIVSMVWATWSPAARMELPDIQRLYSEHHDQGLEIVALSIDEHIGEVRDFWRKRGYSLPVAMRSDAFFEHYGRVHTTPTFYIVDRQGILRHRIAGTVDPEKLESLLKPLLAEGPRTNSLVRK